MQAGRLWPSGPSLELELIQTQMAQKPMLRAEVELRKQSKCGMIQEGEGHWPNSSENLQKARYLWVLRTPQSNKEEGARAKKLVTCGTRGPLGRGQSVPFSAQGAIALPLSHQRL